MNEQRLDAVTQRLDRLERENGRLKMVGAILLLALLALIATIDDPHAIRAILAHLGLPTEARHPDPARPPPAESPRLLADILA